MVQRKALKNAQGKQQLLKCLRNWSLHRQMEFRAQRVGRAGKCWAQKENIKRLHSVASAVLQLDQVTEHPKFMMLSAKQEAISGAFRNNEILISLKTGE